MAQNGAYRRIGGVLYVLKPRTYIVTITHSGVAGSTNNGTINIDPDGPFLLRRIHVSDSGDPSTAAPGLYGQYENFWQVQDNTNNYSWENQATLRSELAGTRELPHVLEDEILINPNTRFTVTSQEPGATGTTATSTAAAVGVSQFSLVGYSLYEVPASQQ